MALLLLPWTPPRHSGPVVVKNNLGSFENGPLERPMPRFDRGPPGVERNVPQVPRDRTKVWRPQRRRWRSYNATPATAITGALVGLCCSLASVKALLASYDHVSKNPLAHDVPFGLTDDVNQALATMLLGFGWLGVSLFAVSSVGLALLAAKLIRSESKDATRNIVRRRMMTLVGIAVSIMAVDEKFVAAEVNSRASEIFHRSCMGCHARGGNILQPGATLRTEDLERNGFSTVQDIFSITYSGKARMPGFGESCTPRGQCTFGPRLSDEDIQALSEFVKSQADQGWPVPEAP